MRLRILFLVVIGGCKPSAQSQIGLECGKNGDCVSGQCLPVGDQVAVCTAGCSGFSECPIGWRCEPLDPGTPPICQCTVSAEVCDGIDNDCNGFADDNCGSGGQPDFASADLATPPLQNATLVDILFVVDDSPSMRPKQEELKRSFPRFVQALDAAGTPAWYHIGVVTSDLGAAQSTSSSNCRPGGLGARLQKLGRASAAGCLGVTGSVNFIDYNQLNGTSNLPAGQDLATTFGCMASAGDTGCGFEHTLEAAYRALHDCMPDASGSYPDCSIPENRGFLRRDAILLVVFLTDEDDCSAPISTDLFDLTSTSKYGSLLSYRCTNYGIMCGNPPMLPPYGDSGGPLAQCQAATATAGGILLEVSRYIDFFANGVKTNPRQVILASLFGAPSSVVTFIGSPVTHQPCAPGSVLDGVKCAVLLQHVCGTGTVFGDPAVRINQLLSSARNHVEGSICDTDYSPTLQTIAAKLSSVRQGG